MGFQQNNKPQMPWPDYGKLANPQNQSADKPAGKTDDMRFGSPQPTHGPALVWESATVDRATFIFNTYLHLAAAVLAFAGLTALIINSPVGESLTRMVLGGGKVGWLVVLGGFMLIGWLAESFAHSETSKPVQYMGLGLYVVAEAFIFTPLLFIAAGFYADAIPTAGLMTGVIFAGLTGFVMLTRYDFSFLRGALCVAGLAAMGFIVASMIFGFSLGLVFVVVMIALAGLYILYDTSNVMHHYRTDQHVAASLALFASVALMFWYVLQLVMRTGGSSSDSSTGGSWSSDD